MKLSYSGCSIGVLCNIVGLNTLAFFTGDDNAYFVVGLNFSFLDFEVLDFEFYFLGVFGDISDFYTEAFDF